MGPAGPTVPFALGETFGQDRLDRCALAQCLVETGDARVQRRYHLRGDLCPSRYGGSGAHRGGLGPRRERHRRVVADDRYIEGGLEQFGFRSEAGVERLHRHARLPGDIAHIRRHPPPLGEDPTRRGDDRRAGLLGLHPPARRTVATLTSGCIPIVRKSRLGRTRVCHIPQARTNLFLIQCRYG